MFLSNPPRVLAAPGPESSPRGEAAPDGPPETNSSPLLWRERGVLRDLARLVADRAATEPRLNAEFQAQSQAVETEFEAAYQAVIARFASEKEGVEHEFQEARATILARSK